MHPMQEGEVEERGSVECQLMKLNPRGRKIKAVRQMS